MNPNDLPVAAAAAPSVFLNVERFQAAVRMAHLLAESSLVPEAFQGSVPNCTIAIELSERMAMSPLMVMQHLSVVRGKPSWDGQMVIAKINSCGRYEPLQFRFDGEGDQCGCTAWTRPIGSDRVLEGPKVTWAMVKAEGWNKREDSKWRTIPDVMFPYRAASFFGKRNCPELLVGMPTTDELLDFAGAPTVKNMGAAEVVRDPEPAAGGEDLEAILAAAKMPKQAAEEGARADPSAAASTQTATAPEQADNSAPAKSALASTAAAASKAAHPPKAAAQAAGAASSRFTVSKLIRQADQAKTLADLDQVAAEAEQSLDGEARAEVLDYVRTSRSAFATTPKDNGGEPNAPLFGQ